MGRAYSCWMLNWWCITQQVGFKRLMATDCRTLTCYTQSLACVPISVQWSLEVCEPQCSGCQTFLITHYNTITLTFHGWFQRIRKNGSNGWLVCLPTLSWYCADHSQPCLSQSRVNSQVLQKWPSRCNCVGQFIIPLFLDCSTCFERYYRSSSGASKL